VVFVDRILVVDDEKAIADIVSWNLERAGFRVDVAYSGAQALRQVESSRPSLIVLDIMLPEGDGFRVCREVRRRFTVPILMLTAKNGEEDKVRGLELGADDYMTKPFSPRELVARIKAILRRATPEPGIDRQAAYICGDLELDPTAHAVRRAGAPIDLTVREFALLQYLLERVDQVITREQLLADVWGYDYFGDMRTVDVTVRRLREKVEDDASAPRYILTRRGLGYMVPREPATRATP
jgi:two-component system response regulator VicR